MRKTKRYRLIAASLIVTALVAAACGDSGTTTPKASGTSGTGTSGTSGTSSASGSASGGPTTTVKNTASDQGVTETEIKVVILAADLTNLIKNGLIKNVPDNAYELNQKRVSYYTDKTNAAGGINGRKIVTSAVGWDPVDPKSFDTACQKVADAKPFLVINVGGGYNPDKIPCVVDAGTYFIGIDSIGLAGWSAVVGKAITIAPPSEISAQAGAEALVKTIPKTEKLGFLLGNNPFQVDAYARAKKVFQAAGFTIAYDTIINTATQTGGDVNKDVLLSVPKMQSAGVTWVVSMLPFTNAGNFAGEADKSGLKAKYSLIDISSGMCTTFSASQVSATMDGATCVAHWDNFRYDDTGKLKPDTAFEAKCRTEYEEIYGFKTVPGSKFAGSPDGSIKEDQSYYECTLMNAVVLPALKAAGANLTRKTFNDAALKLGTFEVGGFSNQKGSLGPDKPFIAASLQQMTIVLSGTTKGADGFYGKCPLPQTNCMRTNSAAGWTPITATLKG